MEELKVEVKDVSVNTALNVIKDSMRCRFGKKPSAYEDLVNDFIKSGKDCVEIMLPDEVVKIDAKWNCETQKLRSEADKNPNHVQVMTSRPYVFLFNPAKLPASKRSKKYNKFDQAYIY